MSTLDDHHIDELKAMVRHSVDFFDRVSDIMDQSRVEGLERDQVSVVEAMAEEAGEELRGMLSSYRIFGGAL